MEPLRGSPLQLIAFPNEAFAQKRSASSGLYTCMASGQYIYICTTNSEDTQNARATQTGRDGSHLGSGNGANQPGRQPRTNYNRIRAGYIFNP